MCLDRDGGVATDMPALPLVVGSVTRTSTTEVEVDAMSQRDQNTLTVYASTPYRGTLMHMASTILWHHCMPMHVVFVQALAHRLHSLNSN